jgi:hypothetical protein
MKHFFENRRCHFGTTDNMGQKAKKIYFLLLKFLACPEQRRRAKHDRLKTHRICLPPMFILPALSLVEVSKAKNIICHLCPDASLRSA